MMRIKTLLFLLLFAGTALAGGRRIDIYLGFDDCVNCYASLAAIESVSGYEKTILIPRSDSLLFVEFIQSYRIPASVNYSYFQGKSSGFSYCKVYVNQQLTDSFSLALLSAKVQQLNRSAESPASNAIRSFVIPANTTLKANRLKLLLNGNRLAVFDYILNKAMVLTIDAAKDTLQKSIELKGPQFSQKLLLRLGGLDSVFYFNCLDYLQKTGKATAHIEGSFLSDSSLFVLLNFPWIHTEKAHPSDTVVDVSYFLYERNLLSGSKKLSYISEEQLLKATSQRYSINNSRPFFIDDRSGTAVFSILDEDTLSKTMQLFSEFTPVKTRYRFKRLNSIGISKAYYNAGMIDAYDVLSNRQFYFSIKLGLIIDYRNNTTISLKNYELPATAFGADIVREGDRLKLLILDNQEVEVLTYDLNAHTVMHGTKHALPADCSINSIRFYDATHIFFFNKNASLLHVMDMGR